MAFKDQEEMGTAAVGMHLKRRGVLSLPQQEGKEWQVMQVGYNPRYIYLGISSTANNEIRILNFIALQCKLTQTCIFTF